LLSGGVVESHRHLMALWHCFCNSSETH